MDDDGFPDDFEDLADMARTGDLFGLADGQIIVNVHTPEECMPPCPVHAPSSHHMRDWRLVWNGRRKTLVRVCAHQFPHPDPDDIAVDWDPLVGFHLCDGCCNPSRASRATHV